MSEPHDPSVPWGKPPEAPPSWPPAPPSWQQPPGPPGGPPGGPPSGPPPGWGAPPPPPPRRSRVPLVLGLLAALVMVTVAITIPLVLTRDDDDERGAGQEPSPTDTGVPSGEESSDLGGELAGVDVYDDLPATHVDEPIDYEQTPPVGGAHYARWLDCGVYDRPVPDVVAVHDLEHGTVWITYDADTLSDEDVDALADVLPQNGILSPYVGLDAPVVVTVWGRQLALSGADDPLLPVFIDEYEGGVTAPEPYASCAGGLSLSQAESFTGTLTS